MTDTAVKTPLSDLVASALDAMRRGGAMRVMDIPDDSSYSSHTFSGEVSQEISRRADLAAVTAQVNEEQNTEQRKRFWNWLPLAYRDGHIGEHAKFTKYNMEVAHYAGWCQAIEPQPDPRDEAIKGLVEAVEHLLRNYLQDELDEPDLCVNDDHWTAIHDVDAALAAAKAVQHD